MIRLSLISLSLFAFCAQAAELKGTVKYTGATPKEELVKMNADPVCLKENAGKKIPKGDVAVNSNKTLANVFVYIKDFKGTAPAAPTTAVEFDQQGCMYHPRVLGVRVNQPIKLVNSDPTLHNVHALPKANSGFNLGMATKGQTVEKKFTKPEQMVRMKCDVHGWMTAYIGVMDHPYFAVTSGDGGFAIKDLPPGEYTLAAWQEKLGEKTQKVTVKDGAPTAADFTF
jgi:plastocyanin